MNNVYEPGPLSFYSFLIKDWNFSNVRLSSYVIIHLLMLLRSLDTFSIRTTIPLCPCTVEIPIVESLSLWTGLKVSYIHIQFLSPFLSIRFLPLSYPVSCPLTPSNYLKPLTSLKSVDVQSYVSNPSLISTSIPPSVLMTQLSEEKSRLQTWKKDS